MQYTMLHSYQTYSTTGSEATGVTGMDLKYTHTHLYIKYIYI